MLICGVPEKVHAALVLQSEKNRRSKEKQERFLIEGGLRGVVSAKNTVVEADRMRAHCQREVSMTEILQWTETH
jgi:hypothetical protein